MPISLMKSIQVYLHTLDNFFQNTERMTNKRRNEKLFKLTYKHWITFFKTQMKLHKIKK